MNTKEGGRPAGAQLAVIRGVAGTLATLALVLAACSGDEGAASAPGGGGVTTRTPAPDATATTAPAETSTPAPASTAVRTVTPADLSGIEPSDEDIALAALANENPAQIAFLLGELAPRCTEDRAALVDQAERTWRHLNETVGVAVSVSGIIARILMELPPGATTHQCEPLFAAVIVELRGR